MKLNSVDIQVKDFSRSIRGYDTDEVRSFLEKVAKQIESMNYEIQMLRDRLREKEMNLIDFRERETVIRDTVTTAQKVTDNIKRDSIKESAQIINQAKLRAESIIRDTRQNMKKVIDDINRLKKQKTMLASQLKTTLETHIKMIDQLDSQKDDLIELNIPYDAFDSQKL
ncbi:MAG: DivIVA domain-containing protein [Pseudomonadota bacterium]